MEELLIPCTGFVSAFVIIFAFMAFRRYLRHKEIMALAEKGLEFPEIRRNGNGKDTLRWGIMITAVGFALLVGLAPVAWRDGWGFLLFGLIPSFLGLGLILIYILTKENGKSTRAEISETVEHVEEDQSQHLYNNRVT